MLPFIACTNWKQLAKKSGDRRFWMLLIVLPAVANKFLQATMPAKRINK